MVFSASDGYTDMPVKIPCGQCMGCRLEKSKQWAIRMMHEASLHDENSFVTLTYDDLHLPDYGSLNKRDFVLFMKRLRKKYDDRRIRFYACGEYGDSNGRPHYHAIIFGLGFDDRYLWAERRGHKVWRSEGLESCWRKGLSEIGTVTYQSAAYCARYITKKVTGPAAKEYYSRVDPETGEVVQLEPEYATMSKHPGLGKGWLDKYGAETYRDDSVIVDGREVRPPRYYDDKYSDVDSDLVESCKAKRQDARDRREETESRLYVREKVQQSRLSHLKREL